MRSEGIETLKTVARRSAWVVAVLVVVGAVAMNVIRHGQGAQYQASARVILSPVDLASAAAGVNSYVDPTVLDATEQSLASSPQLYSRAANRAGGALGSGTDLRNAITATKSGGTITFAATATTPGRAIALVNAVATTYQSWRAAVSNSNVEKAIKQVQAQLAAVNEKDQSLIDELTRLKSLKYLAGNVLLVERARSAQQTRPRPFRDSLLGGFLGLFVALLVVAVREAIDTRVRSEHEVEDLLNIPVLGTVEALPRRSGIVAFGRHRERYADMYALLAVNLLQTRAPAKSTVIAVTSATAAEGKTTTASNLAAALATRGSSVVVIDLDSRKPSLGRAFGIPASAPGIDEVIRHHANPEEAMWTVSLNGAGGAVSPAGYAGRAATNRGPRSGVGEGEGEGSLQVLPLGGYNGKTSVVTKGANLVDLIAQLRRNADYVIIDTPPALSMPDVTELSQIVDLVLVVVRHGRVSRRSLLALTRIHRNWPDVGIGAVLVGTPRHEESYTYYGKT